MKIYSETPLSDLTIRAHELLINSDLPLLLWPRRGLNELEVAKLEAKALAYPCQGGSAYALTDLGIECCRIIEEKIKAIDYLLSHEVPFGAEGLEVQGNTIIRRG